MRKLLISTALLCVCAMSARAQYLGPTTVTATLKRADGSLCNGTITLAYPTFTSPDGQYNVAGSVTTTVTAGVLSVSLEPGGYSAQYALAPDGCGPSVELWGVPESATPVTLAQVTTLASGFCSVQGTIWPIGCGYGIGSALPAACSIGQVFFLTSGPAGNNWYGCTTANHWSLEGGGGGGGGSPYVVSVSSVSTYTIPAATHAQGTDPIAWLFGATSGTYTITGATNASPIVVTVSSTAGLTASSIVSIAGALGNTAANGIFQIGSVTGTTFALIGSAGNGAWTSGGTVSLGLQAEAPNYFRDSLGNVLLTFVPPFTGVIEIGTGGGGSGGGGGGGTIGGSGTANTLSKFTAGTTIGNSGITDNGTVVSTTEGINFGGAAFTSPMVVTGSAPANCSIGQFYFNSAGGHTFACTASNTWTQVDGGGSGGGSFAGITSGTNTTTLTMGSGGVLTVSGSGIINANNIGGAVVPTSTAFLGTNSSRQLVAAPTPLVASNNLSDLTNVTTAQTNLGLGPFATKSVLVSGDIPNNAANTSGNAATATAFAASPSQCSVGPPQQFSTGITANGTPNCAAITTSAISGVLGVTVGGTGTGTAFTQGSVVFAGAGGTYSQDNANFYYNAASHCLAVGSTICSGGTSPMEISSTGIQLLLNATTGGANLSMQASGHLWTLVGNSGIMGFLDGTYGTSPFAIYAAAPSGSLWIYANGDSTFSCSVDGNYRFDVCNSGSSGTARFYNQTATTGTTRVQIFKGAGDTSTTNTLTSDASASLYGLTLTSLTSTSIPYIGTAGIVSQDNAKLNWVDSTGTLHVNSSGVAGYFAGSGSNPGYVYIDNSGGGQQSTFTLLDAGAVKYQIGKQTDNSFFVYDNVTGRNFLSESSSTGVVYIQPSGGAVTIGSLGSSGYETDITTSAATGTMRVFDQTASTGKTTIRIQEGAGQSTNNVLTVYSNASSLLSFIDANGYFNSPQVQDPSVSAFSLTTTGVLLGSGQPIKWSSTTAYSGSADTGLYRNAAGVLEINNGTAGTYRDLIARNLTLTGIEAASGTYCLQISTTGNVTNTGAACGSGGGGGGAVTSVGLVMPAMFTVTGSPVTTTGNLTAALATQSANTVFAGPTTGSAAAPTFRGLVAADLPAIGSTTQVIYNLAGVSSGSANLTYVSPALTIGVGGGTTGQLVLENGGVSGQGVTVQNNATTSAYNFNLPSSAGSSGNPLCSGGGSSAPMTWCTVTVANGGTGQVTLTNHGVLVGAGTSGISQLSAAALGTILQGNGASSDPSFTATPILGVAGTTLGTLRFAGNTSGTVTVETAAAAGTWTMVLPTGTGTTGQILSTDGTGITSWTSAAVLWNNLGNATGPLTLANGGQATTFNQTSGVNWTWANTTAATSSSTQNSPVHALNGTYWNGSASASDGWTIQDVVAGNPTNGSSTLTFAHTGNTLGPQGISLTTSGGLTGGATYTVTGATNASPIVVTVSSTAGLNSSSSLYLSGCAGNTNANGTYFIGSLTGTTFSLLGSSGNGVFSGTCTALVVSYNDVLLMISGAMPSAVSTPQLLQVAFDGKDAGADSYAVEGILNIPSNATQGNSPSAVLGSVTESLGGVFAEAGEFNALCLVANCTLSGIISSVTDIIQSTSASYSCPGAQCPGYSNQMASIMLYSGFGNSSSKQYSGVVMTGISHIQPTVDQTGFYLGPTGADFTTNCSGTNCGIVLNHGIWIDQGAIANSTLCSGSFSSLPGCGTAVLIDAAGPCATIYAATGGRIVPGVDAVTNSSCSSAASGLLTIQGRNSMGLAVPMTLSVTSSGVAEIVTGGSTGILMFAGGLLNLTGTGIYMNGVGTTAGSTDRPLCLSNNGSGQGLVDYGVSGGACGTSIRSTKTNEAEFTHGLDYLNLIHPKTYDLKADGSAWIGFIADDLAAVDYRFGAYTDDGKLTNFKDRAVLAVAVKAIQELEQEVKDLRRELNAR
jgi:hypothetical protein